MKRFSSLFWTALICSVFGLPAGCQPEIEFETLSWDFGDSYPFQSLQHDFKYKNNGTEPLVITNVISTCGCTAAVASASSVLPGKTGIVSVTLTTSSIPGKFEKGIGVVCNDPKRPELTLTLKTQVKQVWRFSPKQSFLLKDVLIGTTDSQQLFLKNLENEPYEIVATKLSKPEFDVEVGERTEEGIPVTVIVHSGKKKGPLSDVLEIRTNHPKAPIVRATVFANVVGFVKFSTPRLYFGSVPAGKTVHRQLNVTLRGSGDQSDLKISQIEPDTENISGKILGQSGGNIRMLFTFTPSGDPGFKTGEVKIHTNIDAEPVATLSYSALVRRAR